MRKRLFRDLNAVVTFMRSRRASIENDFHQGRMPFGPSPRQVRKGAAAVDRLIEDVAWLSQEFAWLAQRSCDKADPNWRFEERLRWRLLKSLIGELEAPVTQYFDVMPVDPEREFLDAPLKMVLEAARQLGAQPSDKGEPPSG
jgi:hypothetical protein